MRSFDQYPVSLLKKLSSAAMASQGDFAAMAAALTPGIAMTPAPAPSTTQGGRATGITPNAKRPLDRATFAVAAGGARLMSQEDLSAGFQNLASKQQTDEAAGRNTAECVHYNSELLNALITRVNAIEATTGLIGKKVEDQDAVMQSLTDDTRGALKALESRVIERDTTLRAELDAMAAKLEQQQSNAARTRRRRELDDTSDLDERARANCRRRGASGRRRRERRPIELGGTTGLMLLV